jgi:glutamyl-tRNA synthetase
LYDDYTHQLIEMGKAYVCTCEKEVWKAHILKQEACPCRELDVNEQKERLKKFLTHTYKQGEAVLRIKTALTHEDPSQRDWALARIVDKPQHYRIKGRYVWPTYNFASAIDDHLTGVTLIIRGQEHYQNMLKQKWLYTHFGWNYPHAFHHGRLLMKGVELSKSKMIAGIASGKYAGWDDPKLFTIRSLQRKGFTSQGVTDLIVDLGVKTSDTTLDVELMGNFNRKYVEKSPSITLVQDPLPLEVDFCPELEVRVDDKVISLKQGRQAFFVSKEDAQHWKEGTLIRLRNAYIAKINSIDEYHVNAQFVSTKKLENTTQINWLIDGVDVKIIMPGLEAKIVYGLAEGQAAHVHVNDEVFFPHFGFCRVDQKDEKEITLWFTHP